MRGNHDGISRKKTLDTGMKNRVSHQQLWGFHGVSGAELRQRPWRQVNLSQEAEYMRKFDYNFQKQNNIVVPETLELAGLFWERLV